MQLNIYILWMEKHPIIQNYRYHYINFIFKPLRFFFFIIIGVHMSTYNTAWVMYILGSCNILFYFNLLINIYAGVFVGDSFCPKGFVLLGGQQVYLVRIIFRCTLYTSKYGLPNKNCFPSLSGKKGTVLKLSLTVVDNSKSLSSFRFY